MGVAHQSQRERAQSVAKREDAILPPVDRAILPLPKVERGEIGEQVYFGARRHSEQYGREGTHREPVEEQKADPQRSKRENGERAERSEERREGKEWDSPVRSR